MNSTIVAKNKTRAHLDVLFQLSLPETLQGGIGTDMEDVDLAGLELSIPGLRGNFCMFCIVFFLLLSVYLGLDLLVQVSLTHSLSPTLQLKKSILWQCLYNMSLLWLLSVLISGEFINTYILASAWGLV